MVDLLAQARDRGDVEILTMAEDAGRMEGQTRGTLVRRTLTPGLPCTGREWRTVPEQQSARLSIMAAGTAAGNPDFTGRDCVLAGRWVSYWTEIPEAFDVLPPMATVME